MGQEQGPSEAHSPNQLTAGTCRHSATFLIPLKANTNNDIGTSASFGTESENCFINHMFRMRFTVNIMADYYALISYHSNTNCFQNSTFFFNIYLY